MRTFLGPSEFHAYQFSHFRLELEDRLLCCKGEAVHLTPKVFNILLLLVQNHGHVLTKEELMSAVWPEAFVEDGNLARNISTLRKVLGETPGQNSFIETICCRGYRFVAEVQVIDSNVDDLEQKVLTHYQSGVDTEANRQILSLLNTAALIQKITGELDELDQQNPLNPADLHIIGAAIP